MVPAGLFLQLFATDFLVDEIPSHVNLACFILTKLGLGGGSGFIQNRIGDKFRFQCILGFVKGTHIYVLSSRVVQKHDS